MFENLRITVLIEMSIFHIILISFPTDNSITLPEKTKYLHNLVVPGA